MLLDTRDHPSLKLLHVSAPTRANEDLGELLSEGQEDQSVHIFDIPALARVHLIRVGCLGLLGVGDSIPH
jgi:hypothetical protein